MPPNLLNRVRNFLERLKKLFKAPWLANVISTASLLLAAYALFISGQQASDAQRDKASNVFFERNGSGSFAEYYIANRYPQPVGDVYYTYKMDGLEAPTEVFIGIIPGCSKVRLRVNNLDTQPGFLPAQLFFTDPNGDSWHREGLSRPTATNGNTLTQDRLETGGTSEPIGGSCP